MLRWAITLGLMLTVWTAGMAQENPLRPARRPPEAMAAPAPVAPAVPSPALAPPAQPAKARAGGGAERRTECSRRYQQAKASNTLDGAKWPAFYSACNTELKSQGQ